ncbi:MAG: NAD-dependent epimerase/dehydratase family protein [Candidatus Lokiarchaeota archaeon]|nr:NAD-dependent epimerase/dehydratase family protein [Candidatus Lokiarchaeota archaeon]
MHSVIKEGIELINNKTDNIFEDLNILVTGGAGFLGSWLCDVLIKKNANVICIDNFYSGKKQNIEHLFGADNFKFIKHDISKEIYFDEKIDYIFHLASRASPFEFTQYPIQILKANTLGTWIVLGIAKRHKSRLFYTSTSEVYGNPSPENIPTPETYNGNVNPTGVRSCYDEAKRAGEAFVNAYRLQHNLKTRIVRIFNTYGPRIRSGSLYGRVIPNFISQALNNKPITVFGDGSQTRSFTYVCDQIIGIIKFASKPDAEGEVINIGNTNETSILELAKIIRNLIDTDSEIVFRPLPPDDPRRRCPDITKAKKILNWKPSIDLQEGLKATLKWFRTINI